MPRPGPLPAAKRDICVRNFLLLRCLRNQGSKEEAAMSTTIETQTDAPTGTWQADTVHSSVAFEVPYAVATFSGHVTDFDATLADGKLAGAARIESIQIKEENLQAH